jgi:hypothetical protein
MTSIPEHVNPSQRRISATLKLEGDELQKAVTLLQAVAERYRTSPALNTSRRMAAPAGNCVQQLIPLDCQAFCKAD